MANSFGSFCDDFFVDMSVNTQLDLPTQRDTILAFFERIQKQFPELSNFSRRESGEYSLEQEQQGQRNRWVSLELDRVTAGWAEPENLNDAYGFQTAVLELIPYMLGVSVLDIDSLDITYSMDFDYQGNHDEVIAEALLGASSFSALLDIPGSKPMGCCPSFVVALSEDCRLQARVAVESRTAAFDVRNDKYKSDEPISLYYTVRRYPLPAPGFDTAKAFLEQCRLAEAMMFDKIIPCFVQPIINAIAQRR
jgi:hypothetical protein